MKKIYSGLLLLVFILLTAFSVNAQVTLTASAGTATGSFTTLKGAFDAINAGTHQGAIVISINGSTTEATTPCVLNSTGAGTALYTSVLIKPTVTATISGATVTGRGLIELNGADNVTIDGAIAVGGTTRDLTITNTALNTITYNMVVRIAVATTIVTSANGNIIKNCIVNGSATGRNVTGNTSTTGSENTTYGIYAGGGASTVAATTAPSAIASTGTVAAAGATYNGLIISNNQINSVARGIAVQGSSTTVCDNLIVTNNLIGAATAGSTSTVYSMGMTLQGFTAASVSGDTVRNIESFLATAVRGIDFGAVSSVGTTAVVENNTIAVINNRSTGGYGAYGINISLSSTSNSTFRNNFVYGLIKDMTGSLGFGTTFNVNGIRVSGGTNYNIYHNTVNLSGALYGTATAQLTACLTITGSTLTNINVRNNIFTNTLTGAAASSAHVCMYLPSSATSTFNLTLNNNAYYTGTTAGAYGIAHAGVSYTNPVTTVGIGLYTAPNFLAGSTTPVTNLRNYTSTLLAANTNNDNASYASTNASPLASATNLHLDLASAELPNVEQKGDATVGVTTDIDGNARPNSGTTIPDMGADEVAVAGCTGTPNTSAISPATANSCVNSTYTMTATGLSTGTGISYQWQSSTTAGGPYANVTGGTGATTSSYTTPALTAGTFYYVLKTTCASSGLTSLSNEFTLTVNAQPTVTVSPTSATFCSPGGTPITLTATGASTYTWSPAAGLSATTGASVTASPTSTTTYTVTGTDGNNCTATATTVITVNAAPVITSTTATPTSVCSGGNSQLQVNVTTSPASYSFVSGTGAALETITTPVTVTTVTSGSVDDGSNEISPAGFSFTYAGSVYTGFSANTNGWLKMAATAPVTNIPTSLTNLGVNGIYAFGHDANLNIANGGNLTHGPAAGGKYVFQFTNNSGASGGAVSATSYITSQIVLWGSTSASPGKIDIIYGSSLGTAGQNGVIGISNSAGLYFNAVTGNSTATTTATAFPASGVIYTFAPPALTYSWTPTTFLSDATIANPVATAVTATTTYTVTVSNGTCSNTGTVTVSLATYTGAPTTQPSTATVAPGGTNAQVLLLDLPQACVAEDLTTLNFTNASTAPADVASAKVYYTTTNTFATTTLFGTTANPGATFAVTGTQTLSTTTRNYFWLVYDIACSAVTNNTVDAGVTNFVVGGNTYTPNAANPTGTRTITALYAPTRADGNGTTAITLGTQNAQMVYALISGSATCPGTVTTVNWTATNTNATDVVNAKCFYTTTSTFSTATPYGTAVANPATGALAFTGSQLLATGSNYFWVVYDINCSGTVGNSVNADINSLVVSGSTIPVTGTATAANLLSALYAPTRTDVNGTTAIQLGTQNAQMVYAVISGSTACPGTVTTVNWTATNTNASDVVNAKAFYTTTSTFSTANPYGSAVLNPATGALTFTGSQLLAAGNNHFWVVYDINCSGTVGNSVNADINSLVVSGSTIPVTGTATSANLLSAFTTYTTVADGDWSNTATWACGSIPPSSTTPVVIAHNITVTTLGNVAGNVTINSGASLTASTGGDLTLGASSAGAATGNSNRLLTVNGTLTVSGGTLHINGAATFATAAVFNMSSGIVNVDPNDGTAGGSSTASGGFTINTPTLNLIGGNINFLDPMYTATAGSSQSILNYSHASLDVTTGATVFTFGGGDDQNPLNVNGFYVESNISTGTLEIGNAIVAGGRFANQRELTSRQSTTNYITKFKNLTVNAGAEVTLTAGSSPFGVTGNLINNGVITNAGAATASGLFFADLQYTTGVVLLPLNSGQSLSGTGFFKKSTADADPTAQTGNILGSMSIYHAVASPGVTLNMPLTVTNNLRLLRGKVNTSTTNFLSLGNGTALIGNPATLTASTGTLDGFAFSPTTTANYNGGYVVGPFNRWFNAVTTVGQQGLMPVGSDTSKPAQILFTTAPTTAGYLTATWVDGIGTSIISPALNEPAVTPSTIDLVLNPYWKIQNGGTLAGGTYTSTFTLNNASNVSNFANTTLLKRIDGGLVSNWSIQGTHIATTGSNTFPTVSRSGLTTFSEFSIGGNSVGVLPVTIEFFRGSKLASANYLDWKVTCTTEPSVSMSLERSSDGRNFKSIQDQTATATRCLQGFNYTDVTPLAGYNYYRLKTVTLDGKVRYSTIVVLLNKEKGFELISLAPNPVKNTAILSLTTVKGGKIEISVSDVTGKVASKQSIIVIAGNNPISMNFTSLSAGTYIITAINADGEIKTTRFVKY